MQGNYQIFISYRRDGGEDLARLLEYKLTERGFKVFFDVESLRSGSFNRALFEKIAECIDVLVVLPPHGLDRCTDPDDWVRLEIARALKLKKNVIPIMMRNFTFPETLPEDIDALRHMNGISANNEYFEASIEKLVSFLHSKDVVECPNCGAITSAQKKICDYCHTTIFISRIQEVEDKRPEELNRYIQFYKKRLRNSKGESVETFTALGICLLKRNAYDEAIQNLETALNLLPEDGESHYFLTLAIMRKKRPYLHTLKEIKKVVEYLETALTYTTSGKYYYLLYLIQKDFYDKKRLRNGKTAQDLLEKATINKVNEKEIFECKKYCGL